MGNFNLILKLLYFLDLTVKRTNQQDTDQNKNEKTKIRKKSKWDSNPNENNWQSQQADNPPLPTMNAYGPTNMMMPRKNTLLPLLS